MDRSQMAKTLLLRGEESLNMFFSAWQSRYELPNFNPTVYTCMLSMIQNYDICLMYLGRYLNDKGRVLAFHERVKRAESIDLTLYRRQYFACSVDFKDCLDLI